MQPREHDLDHRHLLFVVQPEGDAAAASSPLTEPSPYSVSAMRLPKPASASSAALSMTPWTTCNGLSVRVAHIRPLLHRLQALEHADRGFGVVRLLAMAADSRDCLSRRPTGAVAARLAPAARAHSSRYVKAK